MKRLVCLALAAGLAYASEPARERAAARGLEFIYQTASDPKNFERFGEDYLWCFYTIGSCSRDPALAHRALEMGRERAAVWIREYAHLPSGARADQVWSLAFGAYAAQQLGFPDPKLKEQIRQAAARYTVQDYLSFDPAREAPPADVPDTCSKCSRENPRGETVCRHCGSPLTMRSRYDVWYDALVTTYSGDRYGVTLGAPYSQVIAWLPVMRPYRGWEAGANPDFVDTVYAISHLVYTLNDYSLRGLSRRRFPDEFVFLKANLSEAVTLKDTDMLGEFLDSLKALGLKDRDPHFRSAVDYLLAAQNPDGSWGDPNTKDIYLRYHPTWAAIGGLMRYKWEHR